MDAAWRRIANAVLGTVLAERSSTSRSSCPNDPPPRPGVERVQRLVVLRGEGPAGPARTTRPRRVLDAVLRRRRRRAVCGVAVGGPRRGCRRARGDAGKRPTAWRADATAERIRFAPGILPGRCAGRTGRRSSRRSRSPRTGRGEAFRARARSRPRMTSVGSDVTRPQKLLTPGPTPVPPRCCTPSPSRSSTTGPRTSPPSSAGARAAARGRTAPRTTCSSSRRRAPAGVRVGRRQPPVARRARARRLRGRVRRALGRRWPGVRRRRRAARATSGARRRAPDDLRRALDETAARRSSSSSTRRRRPVSSADVEALAAVARRRARSSSSTPSRASAPSRSRPTPGALDVVVAGLAEGADDAPRPRVRRRVAGARWEPARDRDAAALLLRLGAQRKRAGEELDAPFTPAVSLVAALDVALGLLLDDGLEAAFERHVAPRPRLPRGAKAMGLELFSPDEDGRGRRHRRSSRPTASTAPRLVARAARPLRDHDRRRPRASSIAKICSGSATSATTTCSTSRRARRAVELALLAAGARRRARASRRASRRTRRSRRRGPHGCASSSGRRSPTPASSCCASASTSTSTRRRPRRDDRRLRRDRHPLGDQADRRPDRARRRG